MQRTINTPTGSTVAMSISPASSHDSSCTSSINSPANSYASLSSRRSPKSNSKSTFGLNVLTLLRVIVLATALLFLLVCVLQSQHLVIHDDGITQTHLVDHGGWHPASHRGEWKVDRDDASASMGGFDPLVFESKLTQWRLKTHRLPQQINNPKASRTSRLLQSNNYSTPAQPQHQMHIPFWDQQVVFRSGYSWKLMVVILADDCLTNYRKQPRTSTYPTLLTLQDALQTHHADVVVYFPQTPQSVLFPETSQRARAVQQACQASLQAMIHRAYASNLQSGQLQFVQGVVHRPPPRVAYDYHHHLSAALRQLEAARLPANELPTAQKQMKAKLQAKQLQAEIDHALGLDFCYVAELVHQYGDLLLFLHAGTTFSDALRRHPPGSIDYGWKVVQQYEKFQQRLDRDHLVHRFCYMSFLKEDEWMRIPVGNETAKDFPPRYQGTLGLPTGIVLEKHGLYRLSLVLRSLLPYRKWTTAGLFMKYCDNLLWEAQVLQPVGDEVLKNDTTIEVTSFPPALFQAKAKSNFTLSIPEVTADLVQQQMQRIQQQEQQNSQRSIPVWVTVDNRQLGPQRNTDPADIMQMGASSTSGSATEAKKLITFVVPTSTRPNGIKNQYVTYSLNQLFPQIRRDFMRDGKLQASVLLVICGNTPDELDDHEKGLFEYYGPEIKEGILEIVATNLESYPSLHNLPNNYNDPESRLRWRSKQNLDVSSSFFAAKGRSEYIMLLEDDTGYRENFSPTLKQLIEADQRQEGALIPGDSGLGPFEDDYREHIFAQVHFGFGYSGVLIHDEDALVYAVVHYVLMDEKPCDILFLAAFLQGQVLDQRLRWQQKKVLLTHMGSVSSLKGKIQPVWGLKPSSLL